nr:TIGR02221 family CRISPR-associated protein [Saprospiraceae bacterium]
MSRKVFISFLGTGNYTVVDYQMNDLPPFRTKYIQIASFNYLCSDFNENDKILIFTTPTAKRTNWDDNGHTDRETKEVKPNKGLCTCFRELGVNIDSIEIKEGKQEDEIWDIFQTVFAQLNENDEIIFDITHSFRTIPMLTMVLINYAKFLLNVKIKGIFYGAYDVAGDIKPIWAITAFSELQDWTIAAANYIQFGHAKSLKELSQNEVLPILRSNIHENKTLAQDLFLFAKSLETVSDALATNRGTQIFEARIFKNLNENIEKIKGSNLIPPL